MSRRDQRKRDQARRRNPAARPKPRPKPSFITRLETHAVLEEIQHRAQDQAAGLLGRGEAAAEVARPVRDIALNVVQTSARSGRHACRPGCASCCHTAVAVSAPEAFAIMAYLRQHAGADDLAEVRRRVEANRALAERCSRREYLQKLVPCALLTEDGNCRVHPVRPLACAGYLSTSREACEAEFQRQPGRAAVPIDEQAMFGVLAAARGLEDACAAAGLDGESRELHAMLLRLWDDPDAEQAWARREEVFVGCRPAFGW